MNEKPQNSQSEGMSLSLGDIYFILFRQKWKILTLSVAGILGAVVLLFVVKPPQYQSQAMLSIRYVVEGKSLNPPGDDSNTRMLDEQRASIINTEVATLCSLDLAKQVVQALTPEKVLAKAGGGADTNRAALLINNGLTVEPLMESSVIRITFQHPDPTLVQPILNEIIDAYLVKHVQMHQGLGVPNGFLTNETARLRIELAQTDEELGKIKSAAGIISVEGTQKAYAEQISKIRQDLFSAEAELSEHQAMLGEQMESLGEKSKTTNAALAVQAPFERVDEYKRICGRLALLEQKEQNYLTQQGYTVENVLVKENHEQINQTETLKKSLEEQYPELVMLNIPAPSAIAGQQGEAAFDPKAKSDQIQATALKAKIKTLNLQLDQVWTEASNFGKVETTISELEQKKDVEEANLKYFMNNLEETHINNALGEDKAANISIIQAPSPLVKGWSKTFQKKVIIVAVGGVLVGLVLAFFIELFLDRSLKRPVEIESKLRLPLFISIPDFAKNGHRHLATDKAPLLIMDAVDDVHPATEKGPPGNVVLDPLDRQHPLRRFHEGLRDRLIVHFEVKNVTHNPKLVAVTSCDKGAGVSSVATGLAASLSETGDGNVLLVDMNVEGGAAQQFYKGKLGCGLDAVLEVEARKNALVQKNLYVAAQPVESSDKLASVLPKHLTGLIPKLRASDYDYIIFDMPAVTQTSMTPRLARLMDMVLLVIESEKTDQEVAKRVISLLGESKANVSTVLNKTRTYVPPRLHQEFFDSV
jgi:polysaccharide biosynthesis transport protein